MNTARLFDAAEPFTTPLAAVDVEVMFRNVRRMQTAASDRVGLHLRPMAKTHKSAYVAGLQSDAGAEGLTVATLREAEFLSDAGVTDLLIANPPTGVLKARRLAVLRDQVARLAVSLDSVESAAELPGGIDVMWEIDCGHHRMGSRPEDAVEMVQRLLDFIPIERFRGLLTFPGHAYSSQDRSALQRVAAHELQSVLAPTESLRGMGIPVEEVSVGSSPTALISVGFEGITELRPGAYVYSDAQQVTLGSQDLSDCALAVIATVISTPSRERAVVDAGAKAISADVTVPRLKGYGWIVGRPDLVMDRLSEEQGVITSTKAGASTGLGLGERVAIIPPHCCTTVNLQTAILMVGDERSWWDFISARGWATWRTG